MPESLCERPIHIYMCAAAKDITILSGASIFLMNLSASRAYFFSLWRLKFADSISLKSKGKAEAGLTCSLPIIPVR